MAESRGSPPIRFSNVPRARYREVRKARLAPKVAPTRVNSVPQTNPKTAPAASVRTEPGIQATVAMP